MRISGADRLPVVTIVFIVLYLFSDQNYTILSILKSNIPRYSDVDSMRKIPTPVTIISSCKRQKYIILFSRFLCFTTRDVSKAGSVSIICTNAERKDVKTNVSDPLGRTNLCPTVPAGCVTY
jgi:hypothetical protein